MKKTVLFLTLLILSSCIKEDLILSESITDHPLYSLASFIPSQFDELPKTRSASNVSVENITSLSSFSFTNLPVDALTKSHIESPNNLDDIYIVNYNDGFAIISDNPDYPQIIGYSDTGSISNDISHNGMLIILESLIKSSLVDSIQNESVETKAISTSVAPLVRTKWGQHAPYNWASPVCTNHPNTETHYYVTGCVATAIAQIMAYHKAPAVAHWYLPPTSNNIAGSYTMAWHDISNYWIDVNSYYNDSRAQSHWQEVRALFSMIQHDANIKFSCDKGSTDLSWARSCLKKHGYTMTETFNYNITKIMASLNAGYPVLTDGANAQFGHEWIIDGYKPYGNAILVHCNWGYDGNSDGYFWSDLLDISHPVEADDPNKIVHGGTPFTKSLKIVTNIRKK